ncbi:hypothetical protein N782_15030 [Pontibacillus yanchengensis Y32]|uniref:Sulfatase N-terminal domain-containing protein n=2 Tax=Pontibacillus yanchengensis TaxID=462910 RepID=A0A0A2TEK9_9BACI|nr:hypothetical protein N782_15030 [Pontibacillus yanchengensis Y32]
MMHNPKSIVWFAVITLWVKTVVVSFFGFSLGVDSFFDIVLIICNSMGILMLLVGLSFYFSKRVKPSIIVIIMFLISGLLFGNLLYYRFYSDFVTLPILFQFQNVGGVGASTVELMSLWDILLFVDVLTLMIWLKGWNFKGAFPSKRWKRWYVGASMMLVLTSISLGLLYSPYLLMETYDRQKMVKSVGPYNYHAYDIAHTMYVSFKDTFVSSSTTTNAMSYMKESTPTNNSDLFGIAKGKNLVMISMESTQDFVINEKVEGEEITPFLNSLIKESFYFNQVFDQTAQGKTSDSELMIDTGLYPLESGSVFIRKPQNDFTSLPEILKEKQNVQSYVFHGNIQSFWNREQMYKTFGYKRYYSKKDYHVTEENSVNYGIKDEPFFNQSMEKIKELPQPFYARLITLTNHFPFLLDDEDTHIAKANTQEEVVNRYVTTVRYQDEAIKQFIQSFKEQGLYEDTMFVLYGDHYGISEKYEQGALDLVGQQDTPVNRMRLKQVPLIVHVPGYEGKTISKIGGEVDIRATLLHLLGIEKDNPLSFSRNLFTRSKTEPVIFRNGNFVTAKYMWKGNDCYRKKTGEKIDPSNCEPYRQQVRKELRLSDDIIYGDLGRFVD